MSTWFQSSGLNPQYLMPSLAKCSRLISKGKKELRFTKKRRKETAATFIQSHRRGRQALGQTLLMDELISRSSTFDISVLSMGRQKLKKLHNLPQPHSIGTRIQIQVCVMSHPGKDSQSVGTVLLTTLPRSPFLLSNRTNAHTGDLSHTHLLLEVVKCVFFPLPCLCQLFQMLSSCNLIRYYLSCETVYRERVFL